MELQGWPIVLRRVQDKSNEVLIEQASPLDHRASIKVLKQQTKKRKSKHNNNNTNILQLYFRMGCFCLVIAIVTLQ